jgi:hypothetical protein
LGMQPGARANGAAAGILHCGVYRGGFPDKSTQIGGRREIR